jgi:hypothetical protein
LPTTQFFIVRVAGRLSVTTIAKEQYQHPRRKQRRRTKHYDLEYRPHGTSHDYPWRDVDNAPSSSIPNSGDLQRGTIDRVQDAVSGTSRAAATAVSRAVGTVDAAIGLL